MGVTTALLVSAKVRKRAACFSIQDGAKQALAKTGPVKEMVYAKGQDLKQRTARLSQKSLRTIFARSQQSEISAHC